MTHPQSRLRSISLRWFFVFFFISGFCSVLYEIVWLRLAMASFGVTSGLLSLVLSMFMAGLGLGSWASGRLIRNREARLGHSALRLYALAELVIGISAFVVPWELLQGRILVSHFSLAASAAYYLAAGLCLALTLVPWCAHMGATIPFAMLAIQHNLPKDAPRSFSYLYLSNVIGAFLGALLPPLLVEVLGFRGTLRIGALLNSILAVSAFALSFRQASREGLRQEETAKEAAHSSSSGRNGLLVLLFTTGCTSMGVEVVWTRQFTPYVGTVVYAFASLLAMYLISTYIGSQVYRRWSRSHSEVWPLIWVLLGFFGLFAAVTANPQVHLPRLLRLIVGLVPFSGLLGFVTPMLVDRWSHGDPQKAGTAYAVNVLGCIAGPLLSGFLLLPLISERWVLFAFSLPWLVIGCVPSAWLWPDAARGRVLWQRIAAYGVAALAVVCVFASKGYESKFDHTVVLRDNTATIIATGEGQGKRLLVNGVGITKVTPITKMMAHLPLAFLNHPPIDALVVCFGMGTSYRSLLSWNIPTTAVELVPSVPKLFWYFHPGAQGLLTSPLSNIVIDDGREYLERTSQHYDVITIDPPPPVEAAGSSLLYSKEFYLTIRQRLRPGGILQQWLPKGDDADRAAVARALAESFPYVRVFGSLEDWGLHFLASSQPIPQRTAAELAARLPASAVLDMTEWGPAKTAEENFAIVLSRERPITAIIAQAPVSALADDRPVNEYYGLRRYVRPGLRQGWVWVRGRTSGNASAAGR